MTRSVPGFPGAKLPPTERERELLEAKRHAEEAQQHAEQALDHARRQQAEWAQRKHEADEEEESKRGRSIFPKAHSKKQKVSSIAAIVVALGGGAGIATIAKVFTAGELSAAKLDAIHAEQRRQADAIDRLYAHQKTVSDRNATRDEIMQTLLCAYNGGEKFARDVDCRAAKLRPQPLGAPTPVFPSYFVDEYWPTVPRAPSHER